jgi:hypothetical protein
MITVVIFSISGKWGCLVRRSLQPAHTELTLEYPFVPLANIFL